MLAMASQLVVFPCVDRNHQTLGGHHEDALVPQANRGSEVHATNVAYPPLAQDSWLNREAPR